jgi:hypothetical protein
MSNNLIAPIGVYIYIYDVIIKHIITSFNIIAYQFFGWVYYLISSGYVNIHRVYD